MNNTKHTPGPWKAVPDRSRNLYTWYVEGAKGVVPAIARLSLIDACEEIEGNANLIAAAPAMYADGKVLCGLVRDFMNDNRLYDGQVIQAIHNLETALAQAEGQQL